jgi:thiol-disulfide isomerase/thioredoxin
MKKNLFTLFAIFLLTSVSFGQSFQVSVQSNFKSGIIYLTHHSGGNLNVDDSANVTDKGLAVFKGNRSLPTGIYAIVFPGKRITADFLIGKQKDVNISIKADTTNLMKMQVAGSPDNALFEAYQKFVAVKGKQLYDERQAYLNARSAKDSLLHEAAYNKANKELNDYRNNVINTEPGSMMAIILNAMKDPALPPKLPVTRQDSLDNYQYYKAHYWDGISFMDEAVVRTPFFTPKLKRYYEEVIPQASDSIIKDADYKLLLARSAPEMYKYLLNWLTDEYMNPKYMGQDAVFVHLFNEYHSKGLSPWLNEKQMEAVTRRAYMLMANLIGEKAANLEMLDTAGKVSALYDLKSDYTVVVFWDPNCGHCKQEMPRIDSMYRANWKKKNVSIFAVMSETDVDAWKKYINTNQLSGWKHVYQSPERVKADADMQRPSFRQLYDVTQTPTLYLLDNEKRIVGKKLTLEQLNDLLEVKWSAARK